MNTLQTIIVLVTVLVGLATAVIVLFTQTKKRKPSPPVTSGVKTVVQNAGRDATYTDNSIDIK